MSNTLETVLLGNVKPVLEKGVALMTVLAVTSKQTVLTGADEAVVAADGFFFDLKVGQQLIVSEADVEGVWHVIGTKEAVKVKAAGSASRSGCSAEKEMPQL